MADDKTSSSTNRTDATMAHEYLYLPCKIFAMVCATWKRELWEVVVVMVDSGFLSPCSCFCGCCCWGFVLLVFTTTIMRVRESKSRKHYYIRWWDYPTKHTHPPPLRRQQESVPPSLPPSLGWEIKPSSAKHPPAHPTAQPTASDRPTHPRIFPWPPTLPLPSSSSSSELPSVLVCVLLLVFRWILVAVYLSTPPYPYTEHLTQKKMIKGVLIINNHGKPRLSKFYEYFVCTTHTTHHSPPSPTLTPPPYPTTHSSPHTHPSHSPTLQKILLSPHVTTCRQKTSNSKSSGRSSRLFLKGLNVAAIF